MTTPSPYPPAYHSSDITSRYNLKILVSELGEFVMDRSIGWVHEFKFINWYDHMTPSLVISYNKLKIVICLPNLKKLGWSVVWMDGCME